MTQTNRFEKAVKSASEFLNNKPTIAFDELNKKQFTEKEAIIIGRRNVCFKLPLMDIAKGGILGVNAICDDIKCLRCDVKFTATYPEI